MSHWIETCAAGDIEVEDVIRFDHGALSLALYRLQDGRFFASDGFCGHEQVHLADGLVMGRIVESACLAAHGIPRGAAR